MKILMLGWELPPNISGGLGTACAGLLTGMRSIDGVEITFVVPQLFGGEDGSLAHLVGVADFDEPGIAADDHAALPVTRDLLRPYMTADELQLLTELHLLDDLGVEACHAQGGRSGPPAVGVKRPRASSYSLGIMREVKAYAERVVANLDQYGDFDLIHAHDWLTYLAAIEIKDLTGKPLVVQVHSTEFDRAGSNADSSIVEIEQQGMQAADRIVAVSRYTGNVIAEKYHQPRDKIAVVYNGVAHADAPRPAPSREAGATVTFIGRVTYQKGPECFVDAAAEVLRTRPDARFVMAGDGDLLPLMKSLVKSRALASHFEFPGFLTAAGVEALLARSHVYVMPSVSEPFGISALEAVRAMVPVVVSCHCGVSEVVRNMRVADAFDAGEMAAAITEILDDPSLAEEMAQAASGELRELTWERSARQLHGIYSTLLDAVSGVRSVKPDLLHYPGA